MKAVTADHVHMLVGVGPEDSSALVVRAFKGRMARVLWAAFSHRCRFANVWWSPWYFVGSVGSVSESTVCRYRGRQWDAVAS